MSKWENGNLEHRQEFNGGVLEQPIIAPEVSCGFNSASASLMLPTMSNLLQVRCVVALVLVLGNVCLIDCDWNGVPGSSGKS